MLFMNFHDRMERGDNIHGSTMAMYVRTSKCQIRDILDQSLLEANLGNFSGCQHISLKENYICYLKNIVYIPSLLI